MNAWLPVLRLARAHLILLAMVSLVCLAFVFGSAYALQQLRNNLEALQAQGASQQASLTEKEQDLASLQANIDKFRGLQQGGLIGAGDREGWVEQLIASRKQLELPETLSYTLKPPRRRQPGKDDASEAAEPNPTQPSPAPEGTETLVHDLDIELKDIHEGELLALLDDVRAKVRGRFRPQVCRLSSTTESGLTAQCTLRFFTIPAPQAAGRAADS